METDVTVYLDEIGKTFGQERVLDEFVLSIVDQELMVLLGPSGCGKTTVLRTIAGLTTPDWGEVYIGGSAVTRLPTRKRGVGLVFQEYSLFPHMSAWDNVEYGLRIRKMRRDQRRQRVGALLDTVGLTDIGEKYPQHLSGGQQQRVALARALALEPSVLLLDEPLSALDAQVRVRLREEIRRLHREIGTTMLMVTHDQEEALTMADRVGVMSNGKILQLDTPDSVYSTPASSVVARFVGAVNQVPGVRRSNGWVRVLGQELEVRNSEQAQRSSTGTDVQTLVRPEELTVRSDEDGNGYVTGSTRRGAITSLDVAVDDESGPGLRVDIPSHEAERVYVNQRVSVAVRQASVLVDERERPTPLGDGDDPKDA